MATQSTSSTTGKVKIPAITWSPHLTYLLINAVQKPDNRQIAIGKEDDKKTTSEHKTQGFQRIASAVIPEVYAIDAATAGKRTQAKWDSLKKLYREHSKRLFQTGEGLRHESQQQPDEEHHQYADCYVPASGPDDTTTECAQNIWDEIVKEFPYFSSLHSLLSSRVNVNPIAVTTGVGPAGHQTIHYQSPNPDNRLDVNPAARVDDSVIDPILRTQGQAAAPAPTPPHSSMHAPPLHGTAQHPALSAHTLGPATPVSANMQTPLYGSSKLDEAVKKARTAIKPLSSSSNANKRPHSSIEESLISMSRYVYITFVL